MAYYLSVVEQRIVTLTNRLFPGDSSLCEFLVNSFHSGRVSDSKLAYYLAVVNPHLYGEYFSLAHHIPTIDSLNNPDHYLPELFINRSLSQQQKSDVTNLLLFHSKVFLNYLREPVAPESNSCCDEIITCHGKLCRRYNGLPSPLRESVTHFYGDGVVTYPTNQLVKIIRENGPLPCDSVTRAQIIDHLQIHLALVCPK